MCTVNQAEASVGPEGRERQAERLGFGNDSSGSWTIEVSERGGVE
jgi:hypothetical protein